MTDTITELTDSEAAEVKARRAHRRTRPLEDAEIAPEITVPAELPPPPTAVSIAEGRRSEQLRRLRHDLESAQAFTWPANPACGQGEIIRQQQQRAQGAADIATRIAATEALSGWDLVRMYKADESGVYRG